MIMKKGSLRSWVNHKQWNKTLENTKPQNTEAAMSKWASNDCPQRTKQQCTSKPPLGHYKTTIAASWSKMGFIFFLRQQSYSHSWNKNTFPVKCRREYCVENTPNFRFSCLLVSAQNNWVFLQRKVFLSRHLYCLLIF